MRARLKKYLTLTRAGILEFLQFRASMLVILIGNLVYLTVIFYLWKAIYASVDTDVVNGMTFTDTMIYLVLASALFSFMEAYLVWDMGRSIQSGGIVLELLKPMPFPFYKLFYQSGSTLTSFLCTFLPTFIIVEIITDGAIEIGMNIVWFLLSVAMGILINFSIDFFVGTICLYSQSTWGINIMKEVLVLFLSGATVPLAFFPEKFRRVAELLPFQAIYNTPLTLLAGKATSSGEVARMLGFQLFWVLATAGISALFWKKSVRVITVNGG